MEKGAIGTVHDRFDFLLSRPPVRFYILPRICSVVETSDNPQHLKPHLLAFLDEGLRVEEIWILIVGDAWLKVSMVVGKLVDIM